MNPERWHEVSRICAAAIEQSPASRSAFLATACGADLDLRREVESLLAAEDGSVIIDHSLAGAAAAVMDERAAFEPGRWIGHYRIVRLLGAGGMGEVYQAHDSTLQRDVALKILPDTFAHDGDRLARFTREAHMLASLNHSNIAQVYGVHNAEGVHAIAMELVEGKTLADLISAAVRSGAPRHLEVKDALQIARQIAEALEAAHDRGIVHRDLKPANIKVTADAVVKVLDFGLAKPSDAPAPGSGHPATGLTQSPTLTSPALVTGGGVILGTAPYMAPEQAKGKPADKRSDLWAFGCVLYEMLTGVRAFPGDDVAESLAAIIKSEPDWSRLPPDTPPAIHRLLRRCLAKDRRQRLADAVDARLEIDEALTTGAATEDTAVSVRRRAGRQWLPWTAAGVAVSAAVAMAAWSVRPVAVPASVSRLTITLPPGQRLAGAPGLPALALSRDGTLLAYAASTPIDGGRTAQRVYVRPLDSFVAQPIAGTEGGASPFFSPDGTWVGFFADGKLKKVPAAGGTVTVLADAPGIPSQATWGTDGTIVFASRGSNQRLQRVSDVGGPSQTVTRIVSEVAHHGPHLLPGNRTVLFATGPPLGIFAQPVAGGERRVVVPGPVIAPRYASSGHLLFVQDGDLMAALFDVDRSAVTGAAVPMVTQVMNSVTQPAGAQYALSDTGTLAYVQGADVARERRLVWVQRDGSERLLPSPPDHYSHPRLSSDGDVVVFGGNNRISTYDSVREELHQIVTGGITNGDPLWTPDKRIVFTSARAGAVVHRLYIQGANGPAERVTTGDTEQRSTSVSPDGEVVAFQQIGPDTGWDLYTVRLRDRVIEPFLRSPFWEWAAQFSPNGRWLAYASNESGRPEIYVRPFPGPGPRIAVSTQGGTEPMWRRDGRELFYRQGDTMMAAQVGIGSDFVAQTPRPLFTGNYAIGNNRSNYDISPDGLRFLMVKPKEAPGGDTEIHVVLNWFEELRRLVPVR